MIHDPREVGRMFIANLLLLIGTGLFIFLLSWFTEWLQ
jgi:hypothetical protein